MAHQDEPHDGRDAEHPWHEPVVHDKRRIDPVTGKIRHPEEDSSSGKPGDGPDGGDREEHDSQRPETEGMVTDADIDALLSDGAPGNGDAAGSGPEPAEGDALAEAERLAAERLADLQRMTAEFANYRKRTDSNRVAERERVVGEVASALLPVLDDLDRAEKHGDLADEKSGFSTIAAKLRGVAEKLGLTSFGAAGDPFDHNVHDALFQKPDAEVSVDTVAEVVELGYTLGGTLVRPAKVVVATPQQSSAK